MKTKIIFYSHVYTEQHSAKMSVKTVLRVDKQVDVQETYHPREIIDKGGIQKTIQRFAASASNDSNLNFANVSPPSITTVVGRSFIVNYPLYCFVQTPDARRVGQAYGAGSTYPMPYPVFNAIQNGATGSGNAQTTGAPWPTYGGTQATYYSPTGGPTAALTTTAGGSQTVFNYQGGVTGALASFPLNRITNNVQLYINGSATTPRLNTYSHMLSKISTDYERSTIGTIVPSQPDQELLPSPLYLAQQQLMATQSPLIPNGGGTVKDSRGSYLAYVSSVTTANVRYDAYYWNIYEPIVASPLQWGDDTWVAGLSNVFQFQLTFSFDTLMRAFTIAPEALLAATDQFGAGAADTTTVPTINASFSWSNKPSANFVTDPTPSGAVGSSVGGGPQLYLTFITQDPLIEQAQPEMLIYSFEQLQYFSSASTLAGGLSVTAGGVATAQGSTSVSFPVVQMQSIPNKLYIFLRPASSNWSASSSAAAYLSDCYARITNVSIQFGNKAAQLQTMTEQDLYAMSVRNGLKTSFYQWRYGQGSLLIVDVSRDICLPGSDVAGMSGKYTTLQITAQYETSNWKLNALRQCSNYGYAQASGSTAGTIPANSLCTAALPDVAYEAWIITQTQGRCIISKSSCDYNLVGLSVPQVVELTGDAVRKMPHDVLPAVAEGGSIFGTLSNLAHKGLDKFMGITPDDLAKAQRVATNVADTLKTVGMGISDHNIVGGATVGAGGAMVGAGRRMYRA